MNRFNLISGAAAAALSIITAGCGNRTGSDDLVDAAAASCPIPIENVGFISGIELHADTLVYLCSVTSAGVDLPNLGEAREAMKRTMLPSMRSLFADNAALMDRVRQKGWVVSVRYTDKAGHRLDLDFPAAEVSAAIDGSAAAVADPEQRLADEIKLANASLPAPMAPAIMMTRMTDDGKMITYVCEVDETVADTDAIANIRSAAPEIRREMLAALHAAGEPDVERLVEITGSAGRGIRYLYRGDTTGDTVSIAFSADEIKRH